VRARIQWLIKTGVALGITLVIGIGLPKLLTQLPSLAVVRQDLGWGVVCAAVLVTVSGVYASSLCRTSVRAFLLGGALALAGAAAAQGLEPWVLVWAAVAVLSLAFWNFRRLDQPWLRLGVHFVVGGLLLVTLRVLAN